MRPEGERCQATQLKQGKIAWESPCQLAAGAPSSGPADKPEPLMRKAATEEEKSIARSI